VRADGAGRRRCLLGGRVVKRCHHYMYGFYWLREAWDDGRDCHGGHRWAEMETAIAIRIHRRDDVERYRVFACMHSSTGWQTQEHKKQPSLFANDMVRAKHREEMRCSNATTGIVELMEDGKGGGETGAATPRIVQWCVS
jgi:hypothetical protein